MSAGEGVRFERRSMEPQSLVRNRTSRCSSVRPTPSARVRMMMPMPSGRTFSPRSLSRLRSFSSAILRLTPTFAPPCTISTR